jgi:TolA-binding protein
MRDSAYRLFAYLLFASVSISLKAQQNLQTDISSSSANSPDARTVQMEQKLEAISSDLVTTRKQLDQSQQQIQQLQDELAQIRKQLEVNPPSSTSAKAMHAVTTLTSSVADIQERQDTVEAQVKLHEQTKVESSSKYPLRLTGLILFNAFANRGAVDNIDLPSIATREIPWASNGSVGATFRQTILGIEGTGPRIAGARTSADVSMDSSLA